jgi:hypothetical protein
MGLGVSKVLPVPYFAQPTGTTCQATVLKMFAFYLQNRIGVNIGAQFLNPEDVKKDVNNNPNRPDKANYNSHANLRWWLEQQFPSKKAINLATPVVSEAHDFFVRQVNGGMPVLCSVTHTNNTTGHIILVVGYENERPGMSSIDFTLVAHDPFGAYDPSLQSPLYGQNRWKGGQSLMSGGESAPGRNVRLPISAPSRQYSGAHSYGQWLLSSIQP